MGREVTMSESKHGRRMLITCTLALTAWSAAPAQELPSRSLMYSQTR
jgi:hypothetical protein